MNVRDFGIRIGEGKHGERDLITDIPGVRVGQTTVVKNGPDGRPLYNTGVTVIMPCDGFVYDRKPVAASYVLNGYGKTAGTVQINELGTLESPIALTNTLNVGKVSDALIGYMLREGEKPQYDILDQNGKRVQRKIHSINVVVGETNDSSLNTIGDRAVSEEDVLSAIASADKDFAQGAVGAGRGTVCCDLKGGIGSASRVLNYAGRKYTIGALVQSNFGSLQDLMIAGEPVGRKIMALQKEKASNAETQHTPVGSRAAGNSADPEGIPAGKAGQNAGTGSSSGDFPKSTEDVGSIMIVVGTDLPLSHRQLERVLKRAAVGLIRTGSFMGHGSGDVFLGFTNGNCMGVMPNFAEESMRRPELYGSASAKDFITLKAFPEDSINKVFRLAAESVEEAILNSLINAETVQGPTGNTVHCLREYWPFA